MAFLREGKIAMDKKADSFSQDLLDLVDGIPLGRVATYGQLAGLLGRPKNARLVARILAQGQGHHPYHRVVNSQGRLAPAWEEQESLLWAEGVPFKANGCVDLEMAQWAGSSMDE